MSAIGRVVCHTIARERQSLHGEKDVAQAVQQVDRRRLGVHGSLCARVGMIARRHRIAGRSLDDSCLQYGVIGVKVVFFPRRKFDLGECPVGVVDPDDATQRIVVGHMGDALARHLCTAFVDRRGTVDRFEFLDRVTLVVVQRAA